MLSQNEAAAEIKFRAARQNLAARLAGRAAAAGIYYFGHQESRLRSRKGASVLYFFLIRPKTGEKIL